MADNIWFKDWNKSKTYNNDGTVPFYRPMDLTEEEKAQARKNIGVTGSPDITNLENKVDELEGDVASLSGTVGTVSAQFNTLSGDVDDTLTSANAALAGVGAFSADLYTVSAKADTNSGNINSLSAQVVTNTANIASVSGKNTTQDNQISTISGAVNGLTNNVNTVSAKVDSNASNISTLSAAEANDRTNINTLSGNLNTVSGIATSARQEALEAKNTANATSAFCQTNYQNLTSGWSAMQNDWSAFSAAEDAVITTATAAIPGQVSTEVSGQLSGKQNKLTPGVNISLTTAGVIDVKNQNGYATNYSVALGTGCSAIGRWALAHGYNTLVSGANSYSHSEGSTTTAYGNNSHAEGNRTIAASDNAHSEGSGTSAIGNISHSEGFETITRGTASHAEGRNTITSAQGSHAEGYQTSALNENAHAEGSTNVAYGNASHAEGRLNLTSGYGSHAEGYMTSAVNDQSHSEGVSTYAQGNGAHAEGYQTSAMAQRSHAEGRGTITDTNYQHVEGQYNAPATGALHVIGNGTSTANRSNIIETYTDRVNVNGNLITSGYNLNKAAEAMNDFMFDTTTPTGYQAVLKLNTSDWIIANTAYSAYTKRYDRVFVGDIRNPIVGNTQLCGIKDLTAGPVGIVDWKGDISRACWGSTTAYNKNNVSSWPSTIPIDVPNVIRLFSENSNLTSVDQIPTNFIEATSGKSKTRCFQRCIKMSGDVTPYIAAFSAEPAANVQHMFGGCTGVDNYATLSAQYPVFFSNSD